VATVAIPLVFVSLSLHENKKNARQKQMINCFILLFWFKNVNAGLGELCAGERLDDLTDHGKAY
jgi:hypothetical protein